MKELHFDPGTVNDVFDQNTRYAVTTVQKYFGLPRTGVIDLGVQLVLTHFVYSPAEPKSEPDRVEIDLDRQVITLYQDWQPRLLTTTSTGSGEHFCGGVDGCQYAITPTGHFHFYQLIRGWQKGKLGTMWNPYYFNGSDAVHGLQLSHQDPEATDIESGLVHPCACGMRSTTWGSRRSRSPSPSRLKPSTATAMQNPGHNASRGAWSR